MGLAYTPRNTTDLMQVVDFTSLSPARFSSCCIKSVGFMNFNQVCENQTLCSLISTDLLQVIETTCIKLVDKSLDDQLASTLLTTCSRLVVKRCERIVISA